MTSSARPWAHRNPTSPDVQQPVTTPPAPARTFHRSMPGYAATPLVPVPALARRWGIASVHVKDESHRLGLPAFKILGASWAANRGLCARAGRPPAASLADLRDIAGGSGVTLVTATDGNHGRALARMARLLGLAARIYLPGGLPEPTLAAIRGEGATVVDTGATYDDAVARAAESIAGSDLLIQDTAWQGYEQVPGWIVDGYATLLDEIDSQQPDTPTVLAVPTGVGSLLQAVLQHYPAAADRRTRVLAVEPVTAACVTASLATGHPVTVETSAPTCMAGLNCGTVSAIAWPVIRRRLDAAIGVTDDETGWAMGILRENGVPVGPCGAASAAGVQAALDIPGGVETLGLDGDARVVLLSTEGAGEGKDTAWTR